MASYGNSVVTDAGIELLTKAEAGMSTIEFTAFVSGSGEYEDSEKTVDSLKKMTELKKQEQSFLFTSKTIEEGKLKLAVVLNNNELDTGYYMREYGLMAKDTTDPDAVPILYSITVVNVADFMPAKNPQAPTTIALDYYTIISNKVNVEIVIDPSESVTAEDLENVRSTVQKSIDGHISESVGDGYVHGLKYDPEKEELSYKNGDIEKVIKTGVTPEDVEKAASEVQDNLDEHMDDIICGDKFVHGLKYNETDKKLICLNKDGQEIEIKTGGGGSATTLIIVSTKTESFIGKKVTAVGDYDTVEEVFGEDKKCTLGISFIGTYVVSCEGYDVTVVIEQVGTVTEIEINEHYSTVKLSTKSDEFKGKDCVVKNSDDEIVTTVTLPADGSTVSLKFYETGTYTFEVTYDGKEYTSKVNVKELDKEYTTSVNFIMVYGFHVNGSLSEPTTMVTYPDDVANAGFTPVKMNLSTGVMDYGSWKQVLDDWLMPKPCMLNYDGTVAYYLNPEDDTQKEDGTASDVANTSFAGNAMVEWAQGGKMIWIKIVPDADTKSGTIYIADGQADEGFHCWNHYDCEGNAKDHFYTPMYNGSYISSKMRSLSGQTCGNNQTATTEISYAVANNPDASKKHWYTEVLCDWKLLGYLLIMLAKTTNTQEAYGYGRCDSNNSNTIKTGTMNTKGMFFGSSDKTSGVKVFGMENPWGNIYRRIAGYINDHGTQKIKLTPTTADGSTVDGYNTTGSGYISLDDCKVTSSVSGYLKEVTFNEHGFFPKVANGSGTTYYCDYSYIGTSDTYYARVGGDWGDDLGCGALYASLGSAASYSDTDFGASLSYK